MTDNLEIGVGFDTQPAKKSFTELGNSMQNSFGKIGAAINNTFNTTTQSQNAFNAKVEKTKANIADLQRRMAALKDTGAIDLKIQVSTNEFEEALRQQEAAENRLFMLKEKRQASAGRNEYKELSKDITVAEKELNKTITTSDRLLQSLTALEAEQQRIKQSADLSPKYQAMADKVAIAKQELKQLETNSNGAALNTEKIATAFKNTGKASSAFHKKSRGDMSMLQKGFKRLGSIMASAFIFNVFSRGFMEIQKNISALLSTQTEWQNSMNAVKGNLLTAFQPIWDAILPALVAFGNGLKFASSLFVAFVSLISGKSVKSMSDNAKSMDKLGKSASGAGKAAKGALAQFDELYTLQEDTSGGGGEANAPVFDTTQSSSIAENLKQTFTEFFSWLNVNFGDSIKKFANKFLPVIENGKKLFATIFNDILAFGAPIKKWIETDLKQLIITIIDVAGTVIAGTLDSLILYAQGIWDNGLQPILESMFTTIIPLFTQYATELLTLYGTVFEEAKRIADEIFSTAIVPTIQVGADIFVEFWETVKAAWDEHGKVIFDGLNEAVGKTADAFMSMWNNFILPVWLTFMEKIDELWTNHLQPLLANFLAFVGELVTAGLGIYNNFIAPLVTWFWDTFGVFLKNTLQTAINFVGTFVGGLVDRMSNIIGIFRGLITFITGVFTGDWSKAWEGIKAIFKNVFDGLVNIVKTPINMCFDIINGLIAGIVAGVNIVIKAINSIAFTVPKWVPVVGGANIGFSLTELTAPTIPKLATGTVVPPNKEFTAILGDNKQEHEIVSPLSTIEQAVENVLGRTRNGNATTVILQLDKRELGRVVVDASAMENKRIGMRLTTI